MKKLNNKGFAISTMLYGLLIIILLVVAMILSTMAFSRKNSREFTEKIVDELEQTKPICKRATRLHTETCNSKRNTGCLAVGILRGQVITYGNQTVTNGELKTGDAFDCDVNGDGTYSSTNERFYYVTDMDEYTAVLIYYSNVLSGNPNEIATFTYASTGINYNGPTTAKIQLPKTSQWFNISLKNNMRSIKNEDSGTTTGIEDLTSPMSLIDNFNYSNYSTRLLTKQEIEKATNLTTGDLTVGELKDFNYLFEKTSYSDSTLVRGYWLETVSSKYSNMAWNVFSDNVQVGAHYVTISDGYGVRPVIEVAKSRISY